MSRSVHTSRAKFRKAFRFQYSTDEERTRVLGKIIDEIGLKHAIRANVRFRKQSDKAGRIRAGKVYLERRAAVCAAWQPSAEAREIVRFWNRKGYG